MSDEQTNKSAGEVSDPRSSLSFSISNIDYEGMTRSQALNLYTTHFLSTWNVRTYEFAAIIFTAAAYPDTLIAASIRGVVRTLASICFSSIVGRWVDHAPDRLKTLMSTITINRLSVMSASVAWFFIMDSESEGTMSGFLPHNILKGGLLGIILSLGILESLSASGNMLSMERDWVVTAAAPNGRPYDLTHLNSAMRRIDLVCKLLAPVLISVIISTTSVRVGVLVVGCMSTISWRIELWCAQLVWGWNPKLQALKVHDIETELIDSTGSRSLLSRATMGLARYFKDFQNYFGSKVWIPSFALSLLHFSALAYSATFITYLLNVGFSLDLITIARAAGSVVEVSSTIVTPVGVQYLGKAQNHGLFSGEELEIHDSGTGLLERQSDEGGKIETGLERLGLWGISWQLLNLVPVIYALWYLSPPMTSSPNLVSHLLTPRSPQPLLSFLLFFFLSLSRLGLWIYDLTTQQLTQTMTPPSSRSSFTGVEYSFVSTFELGNYILAIVWHRQEDFKWIALMSWAAVAVSTAMYTGWVWKMRGHLVHWERITKGYGKLHVEKSLKRRVTTIPIATSLFPWAELAIRSNSPHYDRKRFTSMQRLKQPRQIQNDQPLKENNAFITMQYHPTLKKSTTSLTQYVKSFGMFRDVGASRVRYHDMDSKSDYLDDEYLQYNDEQFICRGCLSNRTSRSRSKSCEKCICGRPYAESGSEPVNILVGPSGRQGDSIEDRGECLISRSLSTTDSLNSEQRNRKRRASKKENCSTLSLNQRDGNVGFEVKDRRFIRVQSMDSLVKITIEDSPVLSPTTDQSQDTLSSYRNRGRTLRANSRSYNDISICLSHLDNPKLPPPIATENIAEYHKASRVDSQITEFKRKSARVSPQSPTPSQSSSEVPADLLIENLADVGIHEYMSDSMFARLRLKLSDPLPPTKLLCSSFEQDELSSESLPDSILDSTFAKLGSQISNLSLSSSMLDSSWSKMSQEVAREPSPTLTPYPNLENPAMPSEFGFRPT